MNDTVRTAVALMVAFVPVVCIAQIDPSDTGAGTKLGLAQQNNSGQVGTITLFAHGAHATLVEIALASEAPGRREPAHVHRGHACATLDPRPAYGLAPVVSGTSRTIVEVSPARLLSGNYVVNVHASDANPTRYVSCGELHR